MTKPLTSLHHLNQVGQDDFVRVCGSFFEHSPWVAARAWCWRPFASLDELHDRLCRVVSAAPADEKLALINAHPDLVGRLAREGRLTAHSTAEQSAAGLAHLTPEEITQFETFNTQYRDRFGFPFIICARENKKDAILAAFPHRLKQDRPAEIATAISEIGKIARLRMLDAISDDRY